MSAYTYLNCYSSLPSSFSFQDSYDFQTPGWCSQQCTDADSSNMYFALFNHSDCYCSSESIDTSSLSTTDTCTAYCFGYSSEMCGGTSDAYSIYEFDDAISSSSSSASSSSSTSSSSTSSTTTSSATTSSATTSSQVSSISTTTLSKTSSSSRQVDTVTSYITSQVVYSTGTSNVGTSQVVVTEVVSTVISTATQEVVASSSASHQKSNKHIGAIVGGVVGGFFGIVALVIVGLLLLKRISKKREAERLEREYQEAIKPRAFGLTSTGMIANKDIEKNYPESISGRNSGFSNSSNQSGSKGFKGNNIPVAGGILNNSDPANGGTEENFIRPATLNNKNNRVSEYDINKEFESGYVDEQIKNNGNPFSDKHETTSDLNINTNNDNELGYSDDYAPEDEDGSDNYVDFGDNDMGSNLNGHNHYYSNSENEAFDNNLDLDDDEDDDDDEASAGNGLTVANPDSD